MATRWSRAHGELYLRRKWDDGGVVDVEELTVVLWFRGIGQWRSVLVDLARRRPLLPGRRAHGGRRWQRVNWRDEERVARRWLSSRARTHDVEALVEHARHTVISS